jgi:hypothetical protein
MVGSKTFEDTGFGIQKSQLEYLDYNRPRNILRRKIGPRLGGSKHRIM